MGQESQVGATAKAEKCILKGKTEGKSPVRYKRKQRVEDDSSASVLSNRVKSGFT